MNKIIDVSIILVNYNTKQMTRECIESIVEKTRNITYEIILVDNASSDGSKTEFEGREDIIYIYNKDNYGFGKANNIGIQHAKGEYILLLNTDTLLVNDAISIMHEYAGAHKDTVVGSKLLGFDDNYVHSYGCFPTLHKELQQAIRVLFTHTLPFCNTYKNIDYSFNEKNVDYITGADLFLPSSVVKKCGVFDENFFMYYEETDWQKRMSEYGYDRIIIEGPKIKHLEQGSQKIKKQKKSDKALLFSTRSMMYYFSKYNSTVSCVIFRIIYFLLRFFPILFSSYKINTKLQYYKILLSPQSK